MRPIANTDIHQPKIRVVNHAIPGRTPTASLPPLTRPSLGSVSKVGVFKGEGRIAGDCVETPDQLASLSIKGRNIPTGVEFGPAVANQHFAIEESDRSRTGIIGTVSFKGLGFPVYRAVRSIERVHRAVERCDKDAAFIERHTSVHDTTAIHHGTAAIDLGVEGPKQLTFACVDGIDHRPGPRHKHDAIDYQRRRLNAALRTQVDGPSKTQFA